MAGIPHMESGRSCRDDKNHKHGSKGSTRQHYSWREQQGRSGGPKVATLLEGVSDKRDQDQPPLEPRVQRPIQVVWEHRAVCVKWATNAASQACPRLKGYCCAIHTTIPSKYLEKCGEASQGEINPVDGAGCAPASSLRRGIPLRRTC